MPSQAVARRRPLLDVAGVAEYLGTTARHIRRLVADRSIPHHKVGGLLRFDPDTIDGWLEEHQRGPTPVEETSDGAVGSIRSTTRRRSAETEPSRSLPGR